MTDVSIITVSTNEKDFALRLLDSIKRSKTRFKVETILVDNASTDGVSAIVRQKYSEALLLHNQKRLGYIQSNNLAMKEAKGRYIMLVNSDIELGNDTIEVLVNFMDSHPEAAVSTCRLNFDDGTLQLNCRRFPTPLIYISRIPHFFRWLKSGKRLAMNKEVASYLMLDYDHKQAREVDWVVSAIFFMRRQALDDIGQVGEGLMQPFYLEDVDWCFRARLKGWKVYYVPETTAVHYYKRGSVKKFNKLSLVHFVNIMIFFRKHALSMLLKRQRKAGKK